VKRILASTGLLACAGVISLMSAVPAGAAVPVAKGAAETVTGHQTVTPAYEQSLSSSIKCAKWKGDLSWGGNGTPGVEAYIHLTSSVLTDTCSNGYAQLFIHYDTIDNPKNLQVGKNVGPNSSGNRPFSTDDKINTYKDIYVYICSEDSSGYRCGNKKGPGA